MRRHPWEVARADFFLGVLRQSTVLASARSWLDVGAGDAWFASQLRKRVSDGSRLVCWDVNYPADYVSEDLSGLELTADQPQGLFDAILMLDVIEHV
jgi:2-polyprenyl-3-methyl-5-hydroxy-6-metoxy-1,4-benzoquinol methylase